MTPDPSIMERTVPITRSGPFYRKVLDRLRAKSPSCGACGDQVEPDGILLDTLEGPFLACRTCAGRAPGGCTSRPTVEAPPLPISTSRKRCVDPEAPRRVEPPLRVEVLREPKRLAPAREPEWVPSPEEIAAACAEIKAGWSHHERERRRCCSGILDVRALRFAG